MHTHVRITAFLFLAAGGLFAAAAILSSIFFGGLAAFLDGSPEEGTGVGSAVLGLTGMALTVALALLALPSLLCGWGLLKHRRWARTIGIILAAIALVRVPLGTAFGAYVLWVLLSKRSEPVFEPRAGSDA